MIADDKLFILSDNGTLTIAKPSISEYIQIDSYRVIEDGADAWAPLAVADGYMVLRDSETMICLDMAKSRN
jgi:outer membrane protein assembly factor BamB